MDTSSKKVGIITFLSSYNCGSMLQAYALYSFLQGNGYDAEMIDFSSVGQRDIYSVFSKEKTLKNLVINTLFLMHRARIKGNYTNYEDFKHSCFKLAQGTAKSSEELSDEGYRAVVAGADQIWNITIPDFDDAYFLPWVKNAKKIAYAPSFGAKNPAEHTQSTEKYKRFLLDFDALSIRERNGKRWIKELCGRDAQLTLDPSLLLSDKDYEKIVSTELKLPSKYIFYYAPTYSFKMNAFVKRISRKYKLPVIAFNTKAFYLRGMNMCGFSLPDKEDPTAYLQLMKNASLVITTSFHGGIFSSIYRKPFWVLKNGDMFGTDDRVTTMLDMLGLNERLITPEFDPTFDYLKDTDYTEYEKNLPVLKKQSENYLLNALEGRE